MAKRKANKATARRSRSLRRKGKARRTGLDGGGKLPKDAVTLIVILRAKEGQETLLEAELRALVGPSRKEEGCLAFDPYRSTEGPEAFMLHEVWMSREAHAEHRNTPHFLRWNARKDTLITSREGSFWKPVM
jgi:quinol monooxygenase YgiN